MNDEPGPMRQDAHAQDAVDRMQQRRHLAAAFFFQPDVHGREPGIGLGPKIRAVFLGMKTVKGPATGLAVLPRSGDIGRDECRIGGLPRFLPHAERRIGGPRVLPRKKGLVAQGPGGKRRKQGAVKGYGEVGYGKRAVTGTQGRARHCGSGHDPSELQLPPKLS